MIRAALRDIFPSRAQVGVLRSRIAELEQENESLRWMRDHHKAEADALHALHSRAVDERDALRKRALRPDPTPGEARMLEIVRANPGLTAPQLGRIIFELDAAQARVDYVKQYGDEPSPAHWAVGLPDHYQIDLKSKPLSGLACKSLVRREKSGNTYRYWVSE